MDNIKPPYSSAAQALDAAARLVGGRKILADLLGVSVAAIGNWKVRGVPVEHCFAIEQATKGEVTRKDLRPDDWLKIWPELAQATATTAQAATESVAVEAHDDTLRTDAVRRHTPRMVHGLPVDTDRRHPGPPFQGPDKGVA
jgi:DNA-binding transcriptional regulator YdaS (Cro superfamily)